MLQVLTARVFFLLLFIQPTLSGKAVYVSDGDTFVFASPNGKKIKVRIDGVDCPESHQDHGLEAKQFVVNEILNKQVSIEILDTDRYGRKICKVYYGSGKELGKELLKKGHAWHYKAYNRDHELAALETHARLTRQGLWAKNSPLPPWEFRKSGPVLTAGRSANSQKPAVSDMVLICNGASSYAYHRKVCQGLRKCGSETISIPLSQARREERKPCGYCW